MISLEQLIFNQETVFNGKVKTTFAQALSVCRSQPCCLFINLPYLTDVCTKYCHDIECLILQYYDETTDMVTKENNLWIDDCNSLFHPPMNQDAPRLAILKWPLLKNVIPLYEKKIKINRDLGGRLSLIILSESTNKDLTSIKDMYSGYIDFRTLIPNQDGMLTTWNHQCQQGIAINVRDVLTDWSRHTILRFLSQNQI